jgi:hypothetical protein
MTLVCILRFMEDRKGKVPCECQGHESDQLKLVHRWLAELDGPNKSKAFELMNRVMAGEVTSQEAIALLDQIHDSD